jgi:tetratricopeptide (TPR) repeat protein
LGAKNPTNNQKTRFGATRRWAAVFVAAVCMLSVQASIAQVGQSIPTATYFNSFTLLQAGEYRDALKSFSNERGIRAGQARWIDSICYQTMIGECYYKLGQYNDALASYTAALNLYVVYADWMTRLVSPPTLGVVATRPGVPWGRTARTTKIGRFERLTITQGQPITEAAIARGGPIQAPVAVGINAGEVVRCTCLAMMRRAELLGPLAKHDSLAAKVEAAAARRQGLPNHWSRAWLDAQLGFAYAAAGNPGQAFGHLQQSLAIAGEMDHPVTGLALLQLGKLSLDAGRFDEAARFFEEATYTAAEPAHNDMLVLEEAFRYGAIVHAIRRAKTVFEPLEPAANWAARRGVRELHASLVILAAESAAYAGQTRQAAQLVAQARTLIGRRIMGLCEIGARLQFAAALAHYQSGNVPQGDDALNAALKIYKGFSPWLYQLTLTSTELAKNNLSARNARSIFERLGDDPLPSDWVARPLDCLAVLTTPHHATYEQWFDTIPERDLEAALDVADRARRHRFYSALPFGGRLLALRWLLEAPDAALDNDARLERQDLQSRFPAYVDLGKRAGAIRAQLKQLPLAPGEENAEQVRKQSALFAELAELSAGQEVILREIAVRREPADFVFPPLVKMKDVQQELPAGSVLLSVFATSRQLHAVLLSKEKYASWKIERPDVLEKKIVALLRAIGNYDGLRDLPQTHFADTAWEAPARDVIDTFLKGSGLNFAQKFDELIVVPDGAIWYLPFEAVHVGDGKGTVPLITKTRIRYAPTMGLAVAGRAGRLESPTTGLVLSTAASRDEPDATADFVAKMRSSLSKATLLPASLAGPSPYYGALVDGLVVLDDLGNNPKAPFDWSPLPLDRPKTAGAIGNWLALPWKSTDVVALTGFHTAAEGALKDDVNGQDLFLASCGLMATGARTVLLSRWRTGGQSSRELVRQFIQELPYSTASQSWQRAVQLVKASSLDIAAEPRVRASGGGTTIDGRHPFLWAGYMVFDSGVLPHSQEAEPAEPPVVKPEPSADELDQKIAEKAKGAEPAAKKEPSPAKDETGP